MRALIAEDEPHLADDLARRLARLWPQLEIVALVRDGIAARQALLEQAPDIAFLDISMPGLSGLQAAKSAPPGCRVVFVTAHDEHAVAAFEQAAADYLLKPVSDARLEKCLARLKQAMPARADDLLARLQGLLAASGKPEPLRWLRAQVGQDVRLIAVEDVCYFQASDKYTRLLTRDGEFLLRTALKDLAAQLDPALFWRVHRGTLVNARQIKAAKRDLLGRLAITLRDRPETLAVSRGYAHLFRQM
jgi:DNA-binding LytR/AlgR family response regulator